MELKENKKHWENVYGTKASDQVSWFQNYPKTSMEFVSIFDLPRNAAIIDVGGGDSNFADSLLATGFTDVTVLDISQNAIDNAKSRLGTRASDVTWIVADVLDFMPDRKYDFWHDRAAFHFLTDEGHGQQYSEIAASAIRTNGYLIMGTFSETGPKKCSGLEVNQYSQDTLTKTFEAAFERIRCIQEDHRTPFNTIQNFLFCSFRKK